MSDDLRDIFLSTIEASLEAQLRAVRRLRKQPEKTETPRARKSLSQVDMAFAILMSARTPLHVSEIIERIQTRFNVSVDRESLVSSLSKKVARKDRFLRPERNTFSLRSELR
jgi:DNA-directed RNA polymerase delta subunit